MVSAFEELLSEMVDAAMERPWDEPIVGRAAADRIYWDRIEAALARRPTDSPIRPR